MGDTKNEILDAVKLLLGIKDNDKDDVLMLLIEDTVNSVSYTHLTLPTKLEV